MVLTIPDHTSWLQMMYICLSRNIGLMFCELHSSFAKRLSMKALYIYIYIYIYIVGLFTVAHWDLHLVLYFSLQRRNKSLKWLAAAVGDLLFPAFAFLRPVQTSRSGQSRTTPLPPQPSGEHPDQVSQTTPTKG